MIAFILTHLRGLFVLVLTFLAVLALLRFIYRPPVLIGRRNSQSLPPDPSCDLMIKLGDTRQHASHLSGIHILDNGAEAFVARRGMLRLAEHSIDAQYYMWHTDLTGSLLMEELLAAADRGVRVRLLLDDNTTAGTDHMLLAAAAHANVEVRLFNPFILRKPRSPAYVFDLRRLNRRMHNKALIVDGVASIVGGRNIGDEYFNAHLDLDFADMDVLTVGAVVPAIAASFDAYWNSKSAYPLELILKAGQQDVLDKFKTGVAELAETDAAIAYRKHISVTPLVSSGGQVDFDWVPVELVADDPAKGQGDIPRRKLLFTSLSKRLGAVERSVDVVTAYFVPGRQGSTYLGRTARQGRKVRVLTNSLASNDVVPVHAGYARYRKRLLRHGVALHELRNIRDVQPVRRGGKRKLPRFGASSSSLHAKVFVLDKRRVFIGSLNFDPRSIYLNCEMGLLIDSEKLGHKLTRQMDDLISSQSYLPFLEPGNRLSWRDVDNTVYRIEPGSTTRQRIVAWVMSWLPVEWLL
jgi:cardiolipin synthase C